MGRVKEIDKDEDGPNLLLNHHGTNERNINLVVQNSKGPTKISHYDI